MVRTQWGQMETIFFTFCACSVSRLALGELLEDEIVAEAAGWVAGAFFLAQDAVAGAEVAHDFDEAS